MQDYIIRATAANHQIRLLVATTRQLTEKAKNLFEMSPVATAALGRALTAGSMMGAMMKEEKALLTLQVKGNGPIGNIIVTANANATVKGYVEHPQVMLPPNANGKLDVGGAVGKGMLYVIKDLGLKEPYVGQTRLVSGEIAEDLTYYFATSEQTPSAVSLGVLMNSDNTVRQAGGFILQLLPGTDESVIETLEEKVNRLPSMTTLLEEKQTPQAIAKELLGDFEWTILEQVATQFSCNCSKEKMERGIISLGRTELEEMIKEGKEIETRCHFCNATYLFSVAELKKMRERQK